METLLDRDVFLSSCRKLHRAKFAISLVVVERIERMAVCRGEKKRGEIGEISAIKTILY